MGRSFVVCEGLDDGLPALVWFEVGGECAGGDVGDVLDVDGDEGVFAGEFVDALPGGGGGEVPVPGLSGFLCIGVI